MEPVNLVSMQAKRLALTRCRVSCPASVIIPLPSDVSQLMAIGGEKSRNAGEAYRWERDASGRTGTIYPEQSVEC